MRMCRCVAILILMLVTTTAFARNRRCREVICECPPACCSSAASTVKSSAVCATPPPTVAVNAQVVVPAIVESPAEAPAGNQVAPPADKQKPPTELDQILADWEKATSTIRRLDCEFSRFKYDRTFEVEKRGDGSISLDTEKRARYRVRPAVLDKGAVAKMIARGGNRYALAADHADWWQWTGPQLLRIDEAAREYSVAEVSANGKRSFFFSEVDVWDFFLAKPFLLGMPAAELKEQFRVTNLKTTPEEVWLRLIPRQTRISSNVVIATLILDRSRWLTKAVRIQDPTGAESVHVFKNMTVNNLVKWLGDDLSKPNLEGYRQIVNDAPPKAEPPE